MMQVTDKVIDLISQYTDGQGLNLQDKSLMEPRGSLAGSIESKPADKPNPIDQMYGQRGNSVFTLA